MIKNILRLPLDIVSTLGTNRLLLWQFTVRNIRARHKGSYLGVVWMVLNPLLMMSLYSFVFGVIFNGRYDAASDETALDYALGIFLSLTIFQLIAEVMGVSTTIILGNSNIVKRVVFPLEILPVAQVGSSIYHFLISICLVFVGIFVFGRHLSWTAAALPLLVFPVILFSLGLGWLFSAIGVFVRDIGQLMQFLTLALMYCSAIFYPIDRVIVAGFYPVLKFNPLAHIVEQARRTVLWHEPLQLQPVLYIYLTAFAVFMFGFFVFNRLKKGFADVL
ncbi:ABC transporter permease [Puniceicoccus vermicola]|uniref:Transport permease protein n=1 Tax=Puniceicoccus vermicola TaxID=388746 RepID=A0A7X1AYE0_9BACT|nr:ABC transporter permease [Puniceicoccus vermicola]MBC2601110.1 ABC transporter permease [Puniceicoccus vermicola]